MSLIRKFWKERWREADSRAVSALIAASFTGAKRSMLYVTHFKIAIMLS
jgi:hypothetical protein